LVEPALRRWVNQLQQERDGVTPTSEELTPEQQKIQEMEVRINRLEREKSTLKLAIAGAICATHQALQWRSPAITMTYHLLQKHRLM